MSATACIAGDWGTTHLRLWLVGPGGQVLDRATGAGVATEAGIAAGPGLPTAQNCFEERLAALTQPWIRQHGRLPVILSGMIGSTLGWQNVPYVSCPAAPARIADAMAEVGNGTVHIAPGLSCRNRHDAPDVMRGEETQILGALRLQPQLQRGRQLICLPGTHSKWALVADGVIEDFTTAITGELFALIQQHSVLVRGSSPARSDWHAAFDLGVAQSVRFRDAGLTHLLFQARSRQVMGELAREHAADFLSGLLIGHEVIASLHLFERETPAVVTVIASETLLERYGRVLDQQDCKWIAIDGADASVAGLALLNSIRRTDRDHAA